MNDIKELMPEELETISGGRGLNAEEEASQYVINRQYVELRSLYYAKGRMEQWHRVEEIIHEAAAKWYQTIANAPEDHPTIPFSDFFDFEEYKVGI
ncbi:MAG: hypothetical protein IIY30_07920 [Erysipelotrichaceae bacterium]|jgi:hypothetical protein|nr:hypothetical protein [Erysipelotrichaceae bacterium]MBQ2078159.1 hypothetical protein [Erysipelotrichaceae bacterium]MBQ5553132.1 hypothetical protein [Erysipelotrichaceae bacterium]